MNEQPKRSRKWVWVLIIGGGIALAAISGGDSSSTQVPVQSPSPTYTRDLYQNAPVAPSNLSNDNYYTNSVGNQVHSPSYTEDNSIPVGASARCRDGTYSFSQSRRGTCSYHGGVAQWL